VSLFDSKEMVELEGTNLDPTLAILKPTCGPVSHQATTFSFTVPSSPLWQSLHKVRISQSKFTRGLRPGSKELIQAGIVVSLALAASTRRSLITV
jgi:hypothetical protein